MKIIVVGAGVAGMTAAIFLKKAGYDAEVYEKNALSGGLCTGWTREGSYIDGCIHWLTESNRGELYELWREIGALTETTEIFRPDRFYSYRDGDVEISFYTDPEKLEAELLRLAEKRDRKTVRDFVRALKKFASTDVGAPPSKKPFRFWSFREGLNYGLRMLPIFGAMRRFSKIDIAGFADGFESAALRALFRNTPIPKYYSVFSLLVTMGGFAAGNSGIPIGGSKAFAERIEAEAREKGARFLFGAPVEEILTEGDRAIGIRLADGSERRADAVIAACDLHHTLHRLLNNRFSIPELTKRDAAKAANPVGSAFLFSYRTEADLSAVPYSSVFKTEPYSVFGQRFDTVTIRHFGYDPSLAADGKTVVQVLIATDEETFRMLEAKPKAEYDAKKSEALFAMKTVAEAAGRYGTLEPLDAVTPVTFRRYVNAYEGAFMNYPMTAENTQMLLMNDCLPLRRFALATQWLMTPGGLPVAAIEGKFAAMTLIDRIEKEFAVPR